MSDPAAFEDIAPADSSRLFVEVYQRLKAMANRRLGAGGHQTLNPTALVHELYLRMYRKDGLQFGDERQFFAYAARAMRHLLADRVRDRLRLRAGGDWVCVTLDDNDRRLAIDNAEQAMELEQALVQLEQVDPRAAKVVELRYFAGLTLEQVAGTLALGKRTVDRDWRFARAFLHQRL